LDKLKKIDLAILLSILALAIAFSGGVYAQTLRATGENADIYIDYGGLAFQGTTTSFCAIYTTEGGLNSSTNNCFIAENGDGQFKFTAKENCTLQFLTSYSSVVLEGDQNNAIRAINVSDTGLSNEYPVKEGNVVTVTWLTAVAYTLALPIISFWGFVGGSVVSAMGLGGAIKKRSLTLMWVAVIAGFIALVCFIIWSSGMT